MGGPIRLDIPNIDVCLFVDAVVNSDRLTDGVCPLVDPDFHLQRLAFRWCGDNPFGSYPLSQTDQTDKSDQSDHNQYKLPTFIHYFLLFILKLLVKQLLDLLV